MFKKPYKIKTSTTIKGSERRRLRSLLEAQFPGLPPSLVPDAKWSQVKALTHCGATAMIYCCGPNPAFFTVEEGGPFLPSLYALWGGCGGLPTLVTGRPVLERLQGGADLMAPGVLLHDALLPEMQGLQEGGLCAVRVWGSRFPVAVGMSLVSCEGLASGGARGKAVRVVHAYGDTLWMSGERPPMPPQGDELDVDLQEASLSDAPREEETQGKSQEEVVPQEEYTMDEVLRLSFVAALRKKVVLPILTSTFYSGHVLRCCPLPLDVRKTSFRKLSAFVRVLQDEGLLRVQELSPGVDSIVVVHDEPLRQVRLPPLWKSRHQVEEEAPPHVQEHYVFPKVTELRVVSARVKGLFEKYGCRKGDSIPNTTIRDVLKTYVKENSLQNENNKRLVVLDPVLCDCSGLSADALSWEELQDALLRQMPHAHRVQFDGGGAAVTRKGRLQPITLTVETRTANKKVTLVQHLESYGISPEKVSQHVQVAVGASTSLSAGGVLLVQGNQLKYLGKLLLEIFKVPRKHLQGLENLPNKKK